MGGFVLDNLTFRRIDQTLDLVILLSYLVVAVYLLIHLTKVESQAESAQAGGKWQGLALFGLQWVYGGLASASFIFYFRSGTIASSWPFLLALLSMLIGNELLKERYGKLIFRLVVFAFVLLSFVTLVLPVVLRSIGPAVFLAGVVVSLLLLYVCLWLLVRFVPQVANAVRGTAVLAIAIMYALITLAYFANIIPPVPLALKDAQVAYSVTRNASGYQIAAFQETWYQRLWPGRTVIISSGKSLFLYTAIFAPTNLDADIVHVWQKYNDKTGDWETLSRIPYSISGGVSSGYRGYSQKSNVTEGKWRVNVETSRGQTIGSVRFNVAVITFSIAADK